ncbi:MAG: T9SS type A sorting domain-containing protein [Bacteroidota bacterium]|nr:T9SS type A sorting domain-containing protein [Bacteroidota bacterium]
MKKGVVFILLLLLNFTFTYGQIVESSCEAPDSIVEKYQDDAAALTLRKFYENDLPWADSIEIPDAHSDTVLNALLAVWNADELAARDTVVEMFDIHAGIDYSINMLTLKCDTTVSWVEQMENGSFPTGNDTINSLINNYYLSISNIINDTAYPHLYFFLTADSNYNMPQLSTLFENVSGVISVFAMSGNVAHLFHENIEMDIYSDNVVLHYSFGWGDCPSGCLNWRFWDFKVYYDCSVEFIDSYGNALPFGSAGIQSKSTPIEIYPNPANDYVKIKGIGEQDIPLEYVIYNSAGVKVHSGKAIDTSIEFNSKLNNGLYILELYTKEKLIRKKIQILKTD